MDSEITRIMTAIEAGQASASADLLPLVYQELRNLAAQRLAAERPGQTLQATALVHEAYIRLVGDQGDSQRWHNRGHFFAAAAEAMRRILIERARGRGRVKRGGAAKRIDLSQIDAATPEADETLLALNDALAQLEAEDATKAALVKLRFFTGLSESDAADALGISRATASRHWTYARARLFQLLNDDHATENTSNS